MKNLIAIAASGTIAVIAVAFVIKVAVYMVQGRPIAHVSDVRFVLLHDTMILLAVLIAVGLTIVGWIFDYYDPSNVLGWIFRWKQLK